MNVRVKKFFKRIFWLFVSLVIIAILSVQIIYYRTLKNVQPFLIPSQSVYSETIKDVAWVEYRGRGEIEITRTTALGTAFMFLGFVVKDLIQQFDFDDFDKSFAPSTHLVSFNARSILIKADKKIIKDWHLSNIVASIWISQNFTEDQAIATILDKGYFGQGFNSISDVAYFHFDKKVENLSLDEIVFILTMQRAPSYYNPITKPERHEKGAQHLQKQLNKHWPEKYADYVYTRPELVERSEVEKFLKNTEIPYQYLLFSEVMLKYLSHSVQSN